jgi:hypothetical protein
MIKKIANKIVVQDEIKEDFVLDKNGLATDKKYSYKEYSVISEDDTILESGRCAPDHNVNEILKNTGIKLGVSAYYIND